MDGPTGGLMMGGLQMARRFINECDARKHLLAKLWTEFCTWRCNFVMVERFTQEAITYLEASVLAHLAAMQPCSMMLPCVMAIMGSSVPFWAGGKGRVQMAGPDQSSAASNPSIPRCFARSCFVPLRCLGCSTAAGASNAQLAGRARLAFMVAPPD
jgi:hypothetical protein